MSSAELKSELHKLIVETEDINLLNQIKSFIKSLRSSKSSDWWDEIPTEVQQAIDKSVEQADKGEVISHEEVTNELKKEYPHLSL